jgi:hypothetical protein
MPEGIKDTSTVLIPKVDNPVDLKDFRPISLENVLYKKGLIGFMPLQNS